MNFMCVLSRVNTVTFNDVTVDIDLSVYGKSSAEAMVGKRKQMSTPQKQVVISLFEDGVSQHRIAEILGVS
jgi:DNA-directed RNA polymerase specialized sigma subunit